MTMAGGDSDPLTAWRVVERRGAAMLREVRAGYGQAAAAVRTARRKARRNSRWGYNLPFILGKTPPQLTHTTHPPPNLGGGKDSEGLGGFLSDLPHSVPRFIRSFARYHIKRKSLGPPKGRMLTQMMLTFAKLNWGEYFRVYAIRLISYYNFLY